MIKAFQLVLFILSTLAIHAQSSVNLQINHLLSGEPFENEVNTTNDLGNDFMIDRLQYYLSGFSITHDGGQVTTVDDLYVLVSLLESSDPTMIELGEYELETIESIGFYFGVDDTANHEDPSLWPSDHPLAPSFPSMHWGWAAGYRFIAIEGKSGPSINQELQFHCVGDRFHQELVFDVDMTGESIYTVKLDADYTNLLSGVDISSGLIVHGDGNPIPTIANNLMDKVFSLSTITSTADNESVKLFEVFPNPTTNGQVNIKVDVTSANNVLRIHDALGRLIYSSPQKANSQFELSNTGMYILSLVDNDGRTLATRKVVVQ